jgi:type III secretory pathway component EscU
MNKEELYEGIDDTQSITQRYFGLSLTKFFTLVCAVLVLGVYLGVLFYGTNSLEVLFGLDDYEVYLHSEVNRLKRENAELQMEYFELKEISAQ